MCQRQPEFRCLHLGADGVSGRWGRDELGFHVWNSVLLEFTRKGRTKASPAVASEVGVGMSNCPWTGSIKKDKKAFP